MPELAEVEYFRKQWSPGIGQKVTRVLTHPKARIFRDASAGEIERCLEGQSFLESFAHGKKMCFRFSSKVWLGLHLGMAGKLQTATPEIVPDRHDHLAILLPSVALVFSDYRMFGKVQIHQGNSAPFWWNNLPPQPQEAEFTRQRFREILKRRSRRPLKALLLEQADFPGIGNWMADEILWRARVHPTARPQDLSNHYRNRIFDSLKEVCDDAFRVIAPDWGDPPDSWLFNHRWKRSGQCPRSGKALDWITVGGRTTCYSPAIQKLP